MLETNRNQDPKTASRKKLHQTLDALGWGLFFIWIGIAFLADVGWGIGCIGVGVIILGMLGIRIYHTDSDCRKTIHSNCS